MGYRHGAHTAFEIHLHLVWTTKSAEDERAIRGARRGRLVLDRESALKLITDASPLVDAAVRRRPVLSGPPFTLPGHEERPGS